jgi:gluconolactonase
MPSQGSLVEPELDHRSVYRFDATTGHLTRMADFEQPNGLRFSPDGRTLYVSDTSLSLDEIPGESHRHEARNYRLRRGRRWHAIEPSIFLPHRSRLSGRLPRR